MLQSAYFEPFDSDPALTKIGVKNEEQLLQMQLRGRIEVLIGTDCQVDFQLRDPQLAGQLVKLAAAADAAVHRPVARQPASRRA